MTFFDFVINITLCISTVNSHPIIWFFDLLILSIPTIQKKKFEKESSEVWKLWIIYWDFELACIFISSSINLWQPSSPLLPYNALLKSVKKKGRVQHLLIHVCRHCWNIQPSEKIKYIELSAITVAFVSCRRTLLHWCLQSGRCHTHPFFLTLFIISPFQVFHLYQYNPLRETFPY